MLHVRTPLLDIAYEARGTPGGKPVLLLHGWPDDVRTYDGVVDRLVARGFRTYLPWLRGFGATRFLSDATRRSGQISAFAQDALDFADALGLDHFSIVGHDWGARIAYLMASVFPDRIERAVALSLGWQPGPLRAPSLEQARRFWYQWFMATDCGAAVVRERGIEFARFQWETWGPPGWFDEEAFAATSRAFENPDWAAITLHSYRVRWGEAEPDPRYADLERQQYAAPTIHVPTMVIHGADDRCVAASESEGRESYFLGPYERHVLAGVGHFPTREAPAAVAELLVRFLTQA